MNIYYKSSRVGLTPRSFFSHLPLMVIQNKYMLHHSTSLSSSTNIRITLYKFLLHFLYKSHCNLLSSTNIHITLYKFSLSFLYNPPRNNLSINHIPISLYKFPSDFYTSHFTSCLNTNTYMLPSFTYITCSH